MNQYEVDLVSHFANLIWTPVFSSLYTHPFLLLPAFLFPASLPELQCSVVCCKKYFMHKTAVLFKALSVGECRGL